MVRSRSASCSLPQKPQLAALLKLNHAAFCWRGDLDQICKRNDGFLVLNSCQVSCSEKGMVLVQVTRSRGLPRQFRRWSYRPPTQLVTEAVEAPLNGELNPRPHLLGATTATNFFQFANEPGRTRSVAIGRAAG